MGTLPIRCRYTVVEGSRLVVAGCAPGPARDPPALEAVSSIDASSGSAMFFLKDLMPLAKSPINPLILLPPPNSTRITASTTNQCQMLKLPIRPPQPLRQPEHPEVA